MNAPQRIDAACDAIGATIARTMREWPAAPALPRMPADLLRECEQAARIATTYNPED